MIILFFTGLTMLLIGKAINEFSRNLLLFDVGFFFQVIGWVLMTFSVFGMLATWLIRSLL